MIQKAMPLSSPHVLEFTHLLSSEPENGFNFMVVMSKALRYGLEI
jgi:hypothetical protein